MKINVFTAVALAIIVFGVAIRSVAAIAGKSHSPPRDEMYLGLRDLALHTKAEEIGLKPANDRDPYAVIMDIDVGGRSATVTSFATGDASLYVMGGGGTIGSGQASEDVGAFAKVFVRTSAAHLDEMVRATKQPLPEANQVIFYVVTSSGIYTASRSQQALGDGKDSLSPLFYAGQEVLTQIRLVEERQEKERQQRNSR